MNTRLKYRSLSLNDRKPSPWVDFDKQYSSLRKTLMETSTLYQLGFRPVVEMDLDLTCVSAPERASTILKDLAKQAEELRKHLTSPGSAPHLDMLIKALEKTWQQAGSDETLLAGYTDGAIEGYSVYLSEVLPHRLGINLTLEDRETLASWLQKTVYASLRGGYWNRDLTTDTITPGFVEFVSELYKSGGEMVFVSNRSPDMREASLTVINKALQDASALAGATLPLFAYFGPGGSLNDASSKEAAQYHLEKNPEPGIYLGTLKGNQTEYNAPTRVSENDIVVVSVFDDRAASRDIMIGAATRSAALKRKYQLSTIASVGIAVVKHCPELSIMHADDSIASFELS